MLDVKNNTIFLTRGDDGEIELVLRSPAGEAYELEDGEKMFFFVKKKPMGNKDGSPLINKEIIDNTIKIGSMDTANLDYGEYLWLCRLQQSDGCINTISSGSFILGYEANMGV